MEMFDKNMVMLMLMLYGCMSMQQYELIQSRVQFAPELACNNCAWPEIGPIGVVPGLFPGNCRVCPLQKSHCFVLCASSFNDHGIIHRIIVYSRPGPHELQRDGLWLIGAKAKYIVRKEGQRCRQLMKRPLWNVSRTKSPACHRPLRTVIRLCPPDLPEAHRHCIDLRAQ